MTVSNLRIHENMPFGDYLKLPGLSYSTIRNNGEIIKRTAKMEFGSLCDAASLEPASYNQEQRELVRPIQKVVAAELGDLIRVGKTQVVVTCRMEHMGMCIDYKGRIDLLIPKILVIDMKISEMDQAQSVNKFGYHHQLSGYCIPFGIKRALLFSIHPKTKKVSRMKIDVSYQWWHDQVITYGKPVESAVAS